MKLGKKKTVAGILAAAVVLAIGATSVLAAEPNQRKNYVDVNRDGVCDYYGSDKEGTETKGSAYVDANRDGVCDHFDECDECLEDGQGRKICDGQGNHMHGNHDRQRKGRCGANKK